MKSLRSTLLRASTIAVVGGSLVLGGTVIASAAPSTRATSALIDVAFTCTTVTVSSTKDLSNVVLEFADGERERFEDLNTPSGVFAGTGEHLGDVISTTWVKSGANHSDDGPGYGERFDSDQECEDTQEDTELPVIDEEPTVDEPTSDEDEDDTTGDDQADDGEHETDGGDDEEGEDEQQSDDGPQDEDEGTDDEVVLGPATKLERDGDDEGEDEPADDDTVVTDDEDSAPSEVDAPDVTEVLATEETTAPEATDTEIGTPHEVVVVDTVERMVPETDEKPTTDDEVDATDEVAEIEESDDGTEVLGLQLEREPPAPVVGTDEQPLASTLPATGIDTVLLLLVALAALATGGAILLLLEERRVVA